MASSRVTNPKENETLNTEVLIGDMFEWTKDISNKEQRLEKFIYLSDDFCPIIPFIRDGDCEDLCCDHNPLTIKEIADGINDGRISRLPKGTQLIITQEE